MEAGKGGVIVKLEAATEEVEALKQQLQQRDEEMSLLYRMVQQPLKQFKEIQGLTREIREEAQG